jgi:hypothetical protein
MRRKPSQRGVGQLCASFGRPPFFVLIVNRSCSDEGDLVEQDIEGFFSSRFQAEFGGCHETLLSLLPEVFAVITIIQARYIASASVH